MTWAFEQFLCFILFFCFGGIAGLSYNLFFVAKMFLKNKIVVYVFNFLFVVLNFLAYFVLTNLFVFGVFRLYVVCAYLLGNFVVMQTINKIVAKFNICVYNSIIKIFEKLKNNKIFKVIFK